MSIFPQSIQIINKNSYEAIAKAAKNLLESLSQVYSFNYRLTIDEPFVDFLPIRVVSLSLLKIFFVRATI
jgi:hypothetical protein